MKLGKYQLDSVHCGECSAMMKGLPDDCIDLVVTSPPYDNLRDYNGYEFDYKKVISGLSRIMKPGCVVVWVVADATIKGSETGTSFKQALFAMDCGFNLHDTMFYKTNKPPLSHNRYEQSVEYMFVFSKGKPNIFNPIRERCRYHGIDKRRNGHYTHNGGYNEDKRIRNGVKRKPPKPTKIKDHLWHYNTGSGHSGDDLAFTHPASFPEALARDHILSWSNPGDIVLDPMCGSGTTLKMAYQNGRKYIGFDMSQEYCDLSEKRVSWANPPLLVV